MAHSMFLNFFTAIKGTDFYLLLLQLVLCRVAALKVSPYIIHSADYILLLELCDQWEYCENVKLMLCLEPYSRLYLLFDPTLEVKRILFFFVFRLP